MTRSTSTTPDAAPLPGWRDRSPSVRATVGFVAVAAACLALADLEVTTLDPWREMGRLALGMVTPDFTATERLGEAVLFTLAFAFVGLSLAAVAGFGLSLIFHWRIVRSGCAFLRAIHELFWALIFLQVFGLSPVTGIAAIAIPYAAVLAKVYSEILEEANQAPLRALAPGTGRVSAFFFARLPDAWVHIKSYTMYRLECSLRSSAILGFIGLPTIGFHLETAFKQGQYSEVWALLFLFYIVIATMRVWLTRWTLGPILIAAPLVLPAGAAISLDNVIRFVTHDIVPYPIRSGAPLDASALSRLGDWIWMLLRDHALPGIVNTVVLTQIALVATGALTLVFFPLISRQIFGRFGATAGHVFLVVVRSTPEYILAYILLQLWGPSMLPAIVALALHNGAIIGHLIGRQSNELALRPDHANGLDLYAYELVPRLYGQFLAFLFYRWEVIMRETAILGILGIHTLGFFVDNAMATLRFDRALFLIVITAFLNMGIDAISRGVRARLRLTTTPTEN